MGWTCTRGAGQQESRVGRESVVTEQGQGPGSLKGRLVRQGGSMRAAVEPGLSSWQESRAGPWGVSYSWGLTPILCAVHHRSRVPDI